MVATGGGAFLGVAPCGGCSASASGSSCSSSRATRRSRRSSTASCPCSPSLFGEPWPVIVFSPRAAAAWWSSSTARTSRRLRAGTENRGHASRAGARPGSGASARLQLVSAPGRAAGELARSSPTVPSRSASTSWSWIVSRFTWRERRSRRPSSRVAVERLLERDADRVLDEARLEVCVLDDEELVGALQQLVDRRAHRALDDLDEMLGVDSLASRRGACRGRAGCASRAGRARGCARRRRRRIPPRAAGRRRGRARAPARTGTH